MLNIGHTFFYSGRPNKSRIMPSRVHILLQLSPTIPYVHRILILIIILIHLENMTGVVYGLCNAEFWFLKPSNILVMLQNIWVPVFIPVSHIIWYKGGMGGGGYREHFYQCNFNFFPFLPISLEWPKKDIDLFKSMPVCECVPERWRTARKMTGTRRRCRYLY